MSPLVADELAQWAQYIQSATGIYLDGSKGYLIETRFAPLLKEVGTTSFGELLRRTQVDTTGALRRKVVDAITTNETSFFRDNSPFELLQHKLIPDLIDTRNRSTGAVRPIPIRIWSAACSTGQEVYSIAMLFHELKVDLKRFDVRIFGTDISDRALAAASRGTFAKMEIDRGLPLDRLGRYFATDGQTYRVKDEIRAMATFRSINLLEPFTFPHKFDLVLCRNVAIYFTERDKARLFGSIARVMAPDGTLLIGSTETITGICPQFEPKRHVRSVFYSLKVNGS